MDRALVYETSFCGFDPHLRRDYETCLLATKQVSWGMKVCGKCREAKPLDQFTVNRSRKDGLNGYCKSCHRDYTKAHYKAHKQYYVDKARKSSVKLTADRVEWMRALKDKPCKDCGGRFHPCAMDFDHCHGDKVDNVSWMLGKAKSREAILAEIAKCELVCANCHRVRTYNRRKSGA